MDQPGFDLRRFREPPRTRETMPVHRVLKHANGLLPADARKIWAPAGKG